MNFTFLLPLFLLFACAKEEPLPNPPASAFAELEVTVSFCDVQADPFCQTSLTPVPGAEVYLFEHEQFRDEGTHIAFHGTANAAGKVFFPTLEKQEYWLSIIVPDGRSKKDFAKTSIRARTFMPVIFEIQ
ncbi:MAG: hypothetical protein AAB316_03975 [Bacteroidota bacterium]